MFLKEQGKGSLNTQFQQEEGCGLPAVGIGEEGKVYTESQVSKHQKGLRARNVCGRKQWTLSAGIVNHEVSKRQSLFERHRWLPVMDGVQEVPSHLLLLHCRDATAFCSTAPGAAPAVSTGWKLAENKEPGWSHGWAPGWEKGSAWGLCLRGQSLSPLPAEQLCPSQPSSAAASQTRVVPGQRTSCVSRTNTENTSRSVASHKLLQP